MGSETAAAPADPAQAPLRSRVAEAQLRAHYALVPAMVFAPTAGGLYTVWVLWDAEPRITLLAGLAALVALGAGRLVLWVWHRRSPASAGQRRWRVLAVAAAFLSGLLWGSAALVLYPPTLPGYEVYVFVLLSLVPIIPVAALASYLPAFYAYSLTCAAPFILVLALSDSRAERATAVLLVMMLGAMMAFARRYAQALADAITLQLQLAEQATTLERTMRERSRFIAAASHDLREPVHAMMLFLASTHGARAMPVETVVGHIERSLLPLQSMMADLLDISRLDAQTTKAQVRPVALHPMLSRLQIEYAPQAARRGLRLALRVQDLRLRTDPLLMERLLRNLLSNALKYTERGGVLLACRRRGGRACIEVLDTGGGIAEQDLEHARAAFGELQWPAQGRGRGAGLGLAIVQRLASLLGHPLAIRSVPGKGSRITVFVDPTDEAEPAAEAVRSRCAPQTILVVDDEHAVADATARLLRHWGHVVEVAAGPESARRRCARGLQPDLLIVDEALAEAGSGIELVQALRAQTGRRLPALLVSGDGSPALRRRAYEAGLPLLVKPVEPGLLAACVDSLVTTDGD